jgi:hypothetical protein
VHHNDYELTTIYFDFMVKCGVGVLYIYIYIGFECNGCFVTDTTMTKSSKTFDMHKKIIIKINN